MYRLTNWVNGNRGAMAEYPTWSEAVRAVVDEYQWHIGSYTTIEDETGEVVGTHWDVIAAAEETGKKYPPRYAVEQARNERRAEA